MLNNLFKFFRPQPKSSASAKQDEFSGENSEENVTKPISTSKEGEKRLKATTNEYLKLKSQYLSGKYSGHPEDMLEAIDNAEHKMAVLTKAKKRGWTPDAELVKQLELQAIEDAEFLDSSSYSQESIDLIKSNNQTRLEEARRGLR